ncbi:alpha/beta hydrolase family protein [Nocardioides sp. Kera G14]|uniref:alpha/beta hydrolase family protein n=1 Tax=Nocardioides sp. Kera G14 TaxID=2884264 RepID=UPI001D0FCD60|nr:alpha/beta fold hydrolase [Nocardioides sp. Kera G14]UDY23465.1 alpha/beta hydrolase [Nocardioides sp. Kera G14]
MSTTSERIRFASSTGPSLAGIIDLPQGEVRGWGVFAHGFTLGKDCPAASRISRQLAAEGIGMLRFDNLGLGDSEGDWGDGSFTVKVADTLRAIDAMTERGTTADLVVGHSWGGAAAIAAASVHPTVRAVASIAAPSDPSHVEHHYDALVSRVLAEGDAEWLIGGKALTLKRDFVEDVRRAHLLDRVAALGRPLLVMHSPTDDTVGVDNAADIFNAARHPRSFVSLEGSDHLLTLPGRAQRAARIISAWADPYLGSSSLPRRAAYRAVSASSAAPSVR